MSQAAAYSLAVGVGVAVGLWMISGEKPIPVEAKPVLSAPLPPVKRLELEPLPPLVEVPAPPKTEPAATPKAEVKPKPKPRPKMVEPQSQKPPQWDSGPIFRDPWRPQ